MKKLFTLVAIFLIASANSFAYITVYGNMTTNQTWTSGNTYYVVSDVVVDSGVTLTIEQNVVVKFVQYADVQVYGALVVNGVSGGQVFFTSKNDNAVGETISSSSGNPGNEDWGGVIITDANASASISYTTLRYGGKTHTGVWKQGILVFKNAQSSSLEYIFIQQGAFYGLYIENTGVSVDNLDISNHNRGIYLNGGSTSSFSNVWLDPANERLLTIDNAQITDLSAWDITTESNNYIEIYNGIADSSTFNNDDGFVYVLRNEVAANRLYVRKGIVVKGDTASALVITDGLIRTYGEQNRPVIFTSLKDDIGGDTNNDGTASSPAAGDWKGVVVDGTSSSTYAKANLLYTWISYGGDSWNGYPANLFLRNATNNSTVSHCRFASGFGNGVRVASCSPSFSYNSFYNNGGDVMITGSTDVPDFGNPAGNNLFRNAVNVIDNYGTHIINAIGNDWGTNDSADIAQRVGNNITATGEVFFDPRFEKEDAYWQTFDKNAIENEQLYGSLLLTVEETPEGTIVLYKTNEGRYGKFKILERTGSSVDLWWETYNADGTTYSAGTNLHILSYGDGSFCDLDRGMAGIFLNTQQEAEFYLDTNGDLVMANGTAEFLIAYSYCSPIWHSGGTASNQLWTRGTHYVSGDFTIYAGDTLTIEPGSVIKFAQGKDLVVKGTIIALGTQNDTIYFTSANDDSQGCIIDGSTGSPQPDDWGHISFNGNTGESNGEFRFCKFSHGGDGSSGMLAFQYSATGFLKQCTIEHSSSSGLYVYQADIEVDSSTFESNAYHGIQYNYYSTVSVNNSNFLNNGNYAIITSSCDIEPMMNNLASGNSLNGTVVVALGPSGYQRLVNPNSMPFIVFSSLYVGSGKSLNIGGVGPGMSLLKMNANAKIEVSNGGHLNVSGAIITSLKDDSAGGDTNGDGNATTPAPGDWQNITVRYDHDAYIWGTKIYYGGSSTAAVYYTNGAGGDLNNSEVKYSLNHGVYTGSAPLDIWASDVSENTKSGIYIYNSDTTIIHGCEIKNNGEHGVMVAYGSSATINDNDIENNAQYPIYYYGSSNLKTPITGNVLEGNLLDAVVINSLDWYKKQSFYEITGDQSSVKYSYVFLNNSMIYSTTDTLKFNAGSVVKFNEQVYLQTRGKIIADNTVFTSIHDDSYGGDTENNGNAVQAAKGDWRYVEIDQGGEAKYDNCHFYYGGFDNNASVIFYTNSWGSFKNSVVSNSASDGLAISNTNRQVDIMNNTFWLNDRYGIKIYGNDSTKIEGNIIANNGSHGIYLYSTASIDINNNTFTDNTGYPVYYQNSTIDDQFTGNTSSGNLMEGFAIKNLNGYSHNILYFQDNLPFIFTESNISYSSVDTFEVKSMAVIKMFPDVKLEFRGPVITHGGMMTSIKDDGANGDWDTNNDGSATTPAPGDWKGLELYNTQGEFHGFITRYAGGGNTSALDFSNSNGFIYAQIDSSAYDGLRLYNGSNVEVDNASFIGNARYGINISSMDTVSVSNSSFEGNGSHGIYNSYAAPAFDNNTFTGNGGYPVYFTSGSIINKEFTGNTSSGNLMEGFAVQSFDGYTHNIFYHQDDLPFVFPNNIISYSTADTFQIEQATFKFLPDVELELRGPVIANGGVLTSIKDDAYDGDSNNDAAATSPAPGDWRGLELYNNHGEFSGTTIRYAGSGNNPALNFNSSNGYVDVMIDSSAYDGLRLYNGSNVEVDNASFIGNARYGINISSMDTVSVSNSTIQGNGSHGVFMQYSNVKLRGNSIVGNTGYGINNYYTYATNILDLGNNDVNDKGENSIKNNDGGNYQLYNNTSNEINAYYNDWGYNTAAEIDAHIFDDNEDASKGIVHFNPWYVYNLALGVKAFLEGPFNGTDMSTNLNASGLLPLSQPFNGAPWNYTGTESVAAIPNTDVVDWVLLELRDAAGVASAGTGTVIDRKAGFLLKDGSIVETDGSSTLSFAANVSQNLFVVVHHRNHLKIMSANALTQSGGVYTYDFTTGVSQAYLSEEKMVSGKAVLYGGDADADGEIGTNDAALWYDETGTSGYLKTDVTFDGQSDNKDKNDVWVPNNGVQSHIPD